MFTINLPASKSLSNRYLILQALSNQAFEIENLSSSEDTLVLKNALETHALQKYVGDGGTTLRFLLPFLALKNDSEYYEISASHQLEQRPIKPLLQVLEQLGASILKSDFPIVLQSKGLKGTSISIDATVTSQFVSSVLLIAPFLKEPLVLQLQSEPVSSAYIQMTLGVLKQFKASVLQSEYTIKIEPKPLAYHSIQIEADWSAASYWYLLFYFSHYEELHIPNLFQKSLQGDCKIAELALYFGIQTQYFMEGALLKKTPISTFSVKQQLEYDLKPYPDLIPTLVVWLSLLKQNAVIKGVNSLLYKESNRIESLKFNLEQLGVILKHDFENDLFLLETHQLKIPNKIQVNSFSDHRIAMAFSVLHLFTCVEVYNLNCVKKSYPNFWKELTLFIH